MQQTEEFKRLEFKNLKKTFLLTSFKKWRFFKIKNLPTTFNCFWNNVENMKRFIRIKKRRDQKGTQVKLVKWNTKGLNRDKFAEQLAHT